MMRISRLLRRSCSSARAPIIAGRLTTIREQECVQLSSLPCRHSSQRAFLDFYKLANKEAIKKERERIKDEMNRGYFSDMYELQKYGGKVGEANKVIIPAMIAVKFPVREVIRSDGSTFKLPISFKENAADANIHTVPKASLVCLSFRQNSQAMIDSWSVPFANAFNDPDNVHLYEVSLIDQWLLCRGPIKRLLLRTMRKTKHEGNSVLERQVVYSFGDHYYFRKELKILNLLTGYLFLLDKLGRIRWQGFGLAKPDEVASLLSCTEQLLGEQ